MWMVLLFSIPASHSRVVWPSGPKVGPVTIANGFLGETSVPSLKLFPHHCTIQARHLVHFIISLIYQCNRLYIRTREERSVDQLLN